ncbi:MAG TPA: hypothetical protein VGG64_06340 [Pirellulales bacterium]|jgi:hypothetical protein
MDRYVDISFDCLPLRSIERTDIPIDASPKFRARCERILEAIAKHGTLNSYYLYNATCAFHLLNVPDLGVIEFRFEGTAITGASDQKTEVCDLHVELTRETCDWLTEPVVHWFAETVPVAVRAEFDRYITAGDLQQTVERVRKIQADSDDHGGFVGMYL